MKKKVDIRIKTLIENGLKTRQRTLFVIIGDRGRDQVNQKIRKLFLWAFIYKSGCQFSLPVVQNVTEDSSKSALVL